MTESEHACYEVKLNRLLNIQARQNIVWLITSTLLLALLLIVSTLKLGVDFKIFIIIFCGYIFVMAVKLLSNPKCLDVTPNTVKFQYRGAFLHLLIFKRNINGVDANNDETYTLYNIKSIEYLQSGFDKLFSCGHIRICGELNVGKSKKEQRTFVIYGVKDFENTAAWMREYVQLSVD